MRRLLTSAGLDQARLVRVDDRLDAIAQPQLLQDARHMRLGRGLADYEPLADLGVREPACEQLEHLALARRQLVERRRLWPRRRRRAGAAPRELFDHGARDR